jgi:hypothetical protein
VPGAFVLVTAIALLRAADTGGHLVITISS